MLPTYDRNLTFRKNSAYLRRFRRADERTRTADLLITSELLYLLSYVGLFRSPSISQGVRGVILLLGDEAYFSIAQ